MKNWRKYYSSPNSNTDPNKTKLATHLMIHLVYNYGLNWKLFYQNHPILFTYFGNEDDDENATVEQTKQYFDRKNCMAVMLQHEKLCQIYHDIKSTPTSIYYLLSRDVFNIVEEYIPWIKLVKEQNRLSTKKRKIENSI